MRTDPAPGGYQADLVTVLREWGRIGCIGFGGPPAHIALLRKLCVDERGWLDATEFEDAIAACNLLPGPASTQLAIFCAWRVRGRIGALVVLRAVRTAGSAAAAKTVAAAAGGGARCSRWPGSRSRSERCPSAAASSSSR